MLVGLGPLPYSGVLSTVKQGAGWTQSFLHAEGSGQVGKKEESRK